ncbi:HEPN domain-containing protein [Agrobacterium cavarae]|uniref:HEPN domain-containing protein n=1 Tax=Agrobacterium cavarae TaxID=2528239 RepID=UPI003FD3768F
MNYDPRLDGAYSQEELMKCQAFIVFSHAEIENYLEKVARRIMIEAKARWDKHALPDRVIIGLLTYRRNELTSPPDDIRNPTKKQSLNEIVNEAVKLQGEIISDNNGIKTSNLSKLLAPLGVSDLEVEEALLIQLSNMGSRRGDFVHKQSKVSIRNLRDPFTDEVKDINTLLSEIRRFDEKLKIAGLLL